MERLSAVLVHRGRLRSPRRQELRDRAAAGTLHTGKQLGELVDSTVMCMLGHQEQLSAGDLDERTGNRVAAEYGNWTQHPNNPMAKAAE